jgi:hypothetical protein
MNLGGGTHKHSDLARRRKPFSFTHFGSVGCPLQIQPIKARLTGESGFIHMCKPHTQRRLSVEHCNLPSISANVKNFVEK